MSWRKGGLGRAIKMEKQSSLKILTIAISLAFIFWGKEYFNNSQRSGLDANRQEKESPKKEVLSYLITPEAVSLTPTPPRPSDYDGVSTPTPLRPSGNEELGTPTPVPSPTTDVGSPTQTVPTPTLVPAASLTPTSTSEILTPTPFPLVLLPQPESFQRLLVQDEVFPAGWVVSEQQKTGWVSGKIGQGFLVDFGKLTLWGGKTFANAGRISFWLKFNSLLPVGEAPLINWNYDGTENYPFSLFEISIAQGELIFSIYDKTGNQDGIGVQMDNLFEWHKIEALWDFTKSPFERKLFVDENLVASASAEFTPITYDEPFFVLGGNMGGRESASFIIDELILTNRSE